MIINNITMHDRNQMSVYNMVNDILKVKVYSVTKSLVIRFDQVNDQNKQY